MRIIFAGVTAREPLGGPTWVWLQYVLGLQRLGHEVYFLEESGEYPYVYDFERMHESDDPQLGAEYIRKFLTPFGLGERWAYRIGTECFGMRRADFVQLCHEADLLIALPTSVWAWRSEYDAPRVRLFLDVDPGFTQLRAARGDELICQTLEHCNRFFTFGPQLPGRIPRVGKEWRATRPPVFLPEWRFGCDPAAKYFTTLMQWSQDPSPEFNGETYRQKDVEFDRVLDLPRHTAQPLEVAMSGGPLELLQAYGWHVVLGWVPSRDPKSYREYIQSARGEFSVAKNGYVKTQCGWISDRTVCFLASGKPALLQETGLSAWLPTGEGLTTFRTLDEAVTGIEKLNADYERHCRTARQLAEEYFDSDKVLTQLLGDAEV